MSMGIFTVLFYYNIKISYCFFVVSNHLISLSPLMNIPQIWWNSLNTLYKNKKSTKKTRFYLLWNKERLIFQTFEACNTIGQYGSKYPNHKLKMACCLEPLWEFLHTSCICRKQSKSNQAYKELEDQINFCTMLITNLEWLLCSYPYRNDIMHDF